MVHADASNFHSNVTKAEAYAQVLEQAKALMDGQRNWVRTSQLILHTVSLMRTLLEKCNTSAIRHPQPRSFLDVRARVQFLYEVPSCCY